MSHKVVQVRGRSGAELDKMAQSFIKYCQPEVLKKLQYFDVELFFECDLPELMEVTTEYRELSPGIYGYTDVDSRECVISKSLMDEGREGYRNATIAHECGHCVAHVPELSNLKAALKFIHDGDHVKLRLHRQEEIPLYQNPEWQAWRFAGGLLMPAEPFSYAVEKGYSEREIAEIFHVNPAFVRSRAKALHLTLKG